MTTDPGSRLSRAAVLLINGSAGLTGAGRPACDTVPNTVSSISTYCDRQRRSARPPAAVTGHRPVVGRVTSLSAKFLLSFSSETASVSKLYRPHCEVQSTEGVLDINLIPLKLATYNLYLIIFDK